HRCTGIKGKARRKQRQPRSGSAAAGRERHTFQCGFHFVAGHAQNRTAGDSGRKRRMSLFSSLQVSASGMAAQRARAELLVENIANAETTRTPEGGPYRRKDTVFSTE